ncbi:MAG TPA: TRAP transporter substrate-binding protein [Candidatus Limnocylindria bacterium]|nr:TRAP transporter substrate-binding protein [Candidatus Limnocylindria bacterium]
MRKTIAFLLAVLVLATGVSALAQGSRVLKLGHIRDENHPTHKGAELFAMLVKERTNGRYSVNVFPASQLGGIQEMFAQIKTGDLEMVYGGINTMAFISGGEALEITAIPFLYRDYEHMRASLLSEEFAPALKEAEEKTGLKILNIAGDTAPRGLTANKKITTPEDFRGLKIRTAASDTVVRTMQKLGALPQQIPLADLWMALRTNVVDAQENGAITVNNNSFFEVQSHYMKTDYIRDIETFYMSPDLYNSLSEEDRQIFLDASEEAGELVTRLTAEQLETVYDTLAEKMTVVTEPELRLDLFRQELDGLFADWDGVRWPAGMLEVFKNK